MPVRSCDLPRALLFRAAYGTGFRAPDLNYVFRGPGNTHTGGTDYYLCRQDTPDASFSDCQDGDFGDVGFLNHKSGNRRLKPETSTSINAGAVWSPNRHFDISADYFRVVDEEPGARPQHRQRASRRGGLPPRREWRDSQDPTSPTCIDAIARVNRYTSGVLAGQIEGVQVMPINIAREATDGVDVAAHLRFDVNPVGHFELGSSYTYVFRHTIQQYPGDPTINELAFDSDYYIPRDKGTAWITWSCPTFHGDADWAQARQAAELRRGSLSQGELSVQPVRAIRRDETPQSVGHDRQSVRSGADLRLRPGPAIPTTTTPGSMGSGVATTCSSRTKWEGQSGKRFRMVIKFAELGLPAAS